MTYAEGAGPVAALASIGSGECGLRELINLAGIAKKRQISGQAGRDPGNVG